MNRKVIVMSVIVGIVMVVSVARISDKANNGRKYINASHLFEPKVKTNEMSVSELLNSF